jgi:hypothetical protein
MDIFLECPVVLYNLLRICRLIKYSNWHFLTTEVGHNTIAMFYYRNLPKYLQFRGESPALLNNIPLALSL